MNCHFLRTPVLHLVVSGLLGGLLIFLALGPPTGETVENRIVVSNADLEQISARWKRTWMRPPTPEELRGAVADHLRQEVFYREALARGFDREDSVVRMAMVNKIRMLAAVQAEATEPTDDEMEAFFALRKERYRTPGRVSFIHVYYNLDERGEKTEADAEADLAVLRQRDLEAEELVEWGDTTLLPATLTNESEDTVKRTFGAEFTQTVLNLPPGEWSGPVESPYGLHLVRVEEKT